MKYKYIGNDKLRTTIDGINMVLKPFQMIEIQDDTGLDSKLFKKLDMVSKRNKQNKGEL